MYRRFPFLMRSLDYVSAFETQFSYFGRAEKCFSEVNRVLKSGGTFLICNESDGTNAADEKWTKIIGGTKIYNRGSACCYFEKAGSYRDKKYTNTNKH